MSYAIVSQIPTNAVPDSKMTCNTPCFGDGFKQIDTSDII